MRGPVRTAASELRGWTHACASPERGLRVFSGMHPPAYTPCTMLHMPPLDPTPHSSVSSLQALQQPHTSAGGGCHRATQRCTHGLTAPTTSRRGRRACALVGEGAGVEAAVGEGHFTVALSPTRRFQVYVTLRPARQYMCSRAAQHTVWYVRRLAWGGIAGVAVRGSRALTNGRAWVAHDHR
jgi:hypothetical protein